LIFIQTRKEAKLNPISDLDEQRVIKYCNKLFEAAYAQDDFSQLEKVVNLLTMKAHKLKLKYGRGERGVDNYKLWHVLSGSSVYSDFLEPKRLDFAGADSIQVFLEKLCKMFNKNKFNQIQQEFSALANKKGGVR